VTLKEYPDSVLRISREDISQHYGELSGHHRAMKNLESSEARILILCVSKNVKLRPNRVESGLERHSHHPLRLVEAPALIES